MTLTAWITVFQWGLGIVGALVLVPNTAMPPASRNVDHPSRFWRVFFRVMAVLASNLFSWFVTCILIIQVFGDLDTGDMPEGIRALLTLILPLPLLLVFYWLIVKAARKAERDRSRPSH